ncbi:phage tail protein [Bradyrhizobium erythrophlei]|uniref:phage tail protein n=1 Tax=Bradyrhizobium erythrophlei TaxID=1437360 RepID=UPI0035EFF13E
MISDPSGASVGGGGYGGAQEAFDFVLANVKTYTLPTQPTPPVTMGIESSAYDAILYGKTIPIFVGGKALMGGRIIEGPYFGGTQTDPTVSFIASVGISANPSGTRTITSLRLRGKEQWNSVSGSLNAAILTNDRINFRTGTETQTPFQSSIDRFGANAIAYRSHIMCELINVPLKPFGGIIPMPSLEISDSSFGLPSDGITRTEALTVLLRYMRLADSDFVVNVQGSDPAWIVANQMTLVDFLQNFRKIFVNWNISFRDKLRIIEPTTLPIAATLDRTNVIRGSINFSQADVLIQPREKLYSFIDIARDYEPNIASARAEAFPLPTTGNVNSETVELPIVAYADQAAADVNLSLYEELAAQDQFGAVVNPSVSGIEAGDPFQYSDGGASFIGRVFETQRNLANFQVSVIGTEILRCDAACDVPVGAVAHLDFTAPCYWVNGAFYNLSDVVSESGTGGPNVTSAGLVINNPRAAGASRPIVAGPFLSTWKNLILNAGFTVVVEWQRVTTNGPFAILAYFNSADGLHSNELYFGDSGPFARIAADWNFGVAETNPYALPGPSRVAASFVRAASNDPALGHLAIATDISVPEVQTWPSGDPISNVEYISIGSYGPANPNYEYTGQFYIRKITLYALKPDSALKALAVG